MTKMSTERLAQIKARCEAATPGPWAAPALPSSPGWATLTSLRNGQHWGLVAGNALKDCDAAFAAASRQDVPDLLDALAQAEAERDRLGAALATLVIDQDATVTKRDVEIARSLEAGSWGETALGETT